MRDMKATGAIICCAISVLVATAWCDVEHPTPGASPGISGARFASEAYPGFDTDLEVTSPERKEPRWFGFIFGPSRADASDQLAYCRELLEEEEYSAARRELDALVREWPVSKEAPIAQRLLAETLRDKLESYDDSFREFRYLLDFYSLHCDCNEVADQLYRGAQLMQEHGKEVMFVRFANTVDVRKAYETCVMRAPGAKWAAQAMLTVASLREDEDRREDAVKVYENIRNLHPASPEAQEALVREARLRMELLGERGYNRSRCQDTLDFMRAALRTCRPEDVREIRDHQAEALAMIEEGEYREARFYDSPTRTKRSAINAYEDFLKKFPLSAHAEAVRARITELKGER